MAKKQRRAKQGGYEWSPELSRIVPLENNYCYIRDDQGKTHHLKRDSEEYTKLITHLDEVMQGRVTKELQKLGWVN